MRFHLCCLFSKIHFSEIFFAHKAQTQSLAVSYYFETDSNIQTKNFKIRVELPCNNLHNQPIVEFWVMRCDVIVRIHDDKASKWVQGLCTNINSLI